jgi:hypothetical protein
MPSRWFMQDIVPIDNMEVCDRLGLSVVDPFYCSPYAQSLIQELERRRVAGDVEINVAMLL